MKIEFDENIIEKSILENYEVIGVGQVVNSPSDCFITWGKCKEVFRNTSKLVDDFDIVFYLKPKPKRREVTIQDVVHGKMARITFSDVIVKLRGFQIDDKENLFFYVRFSGGAPGMYSPKDLYIEE